MKNVLSIDANNLNALQRAGVYYMVNEKYKEAESFFLKVKSLYPENGVADLLLAGLYELDEKPELSKKYAQLAIKAKIDAPQSLEIIADLALLQGSLQKAKININKALALRPDKASNHATAAETYLRLNNLDKALYHFQEAVRLDISSEENRNLLVDFNVRKYCVLRGIYPYTLFLGMEWSGLYSILSVMLFIPLILWDMFNGYFDEVFLLVLENMVLVFLSIYFLIPYLNRVIGRWAKWGYDSYPFKVSIFLGNVNLQFVIWSMFFAVNSNEKKIWILIAAFLMVYGFAWMVIDWVRHQWQKTAITFYFIFIYLVAFFSLCLILTGSVVPSPLKFVIFTGFAWPFIALLPVFNKWSI
ncbi:MAG: hypothetical protein R2788_05570 [Saprospiraceae bacterium]